MKIYLAADHAGFELKNALAEYLRGIGHEPEDCGAYALDPNDDYPDIVAAAARKLTADLAAGIESCAIIAGGSGQGEAIAANRFKGVRAAVYYGPALREQTDANGSSLDVLTSTRAHNHANCLALAARFLSVDEANEAVRAWLATPASADERHQRRIERLDEIGN